MTHLLWLCTAVLLLPTALADPVIVKVRPLAAVLVEKTYTAPATALAVNNSQISAELTALIRRIEVHVGDVVKVGTTLAQLDCRSYKNALDSALTETDSLLAQVKLATQQLQRAQSLHAEDNLSAEALDQRIASLDSARASARRQEVAVDSARLSVSRCTITAPYHAAVTRRLVGEGTLATTGLPILEITDLKNVEVSVQVPVEQVASLTASQQLIFADDSNRQAVRIRTISPVIDATTRSREVRLVSDATLIPGSSGRLKWFSRPLVPANLLMHRDGQLGVFVADTDNTARFVELPGALEGRPAPTSLPRDTRIVVEGRQQLAAGDALAIAE